MGKLQEYELNLNDIAEWVPWMGILTENIMMNKDDSMMAVISYQIMEKNISSDFAALFKNLGEGISIWVEKNFFDKDTTYLFILWNPVIEKNILLNKLIDISDYTDWRAFDIFLEKLMLVFHKDICNARLLSAQEILNSLYKIIAYDKSIDMPPITFFLDSYLTQDHQYIEEDDFLKIDDFYLKSIRLLGYPNCEQDNILDFLNQNNYLYRYTRRMIFLSDELKAETEDSYLKNWSSSHKSLFKYLAINKESQAIYLNNLICLAQKDKDKLEQDITAVEQYINSLGIATVSNHAALGDVWYGTIPGMFRCDMNHNLIGTKNSAYNIFI